MLQWFRSRPMVHCRLVVPRLLAVLLGVSEMLEASDQYGHGDWGWVVLCSCVSEAERHVELGCR